MTVNALKIHLPATNSRSYPIFVGEGILNKAEYLKPHICGQQVMIVSNTQVAPLYLEALKHTLKEYKVHHIVLPEGEIYKTWDQVMAIFNALLENQCDRSTTLISLGGGVIGDMTGFAAATYMRGIPYIQIPTSLLAQVDASVGGKTAINHPLSKNLVGAFYQPQCVLIDTNTLSTLPEQELYSGLAEVIKHALIASPDFFEWLENNMDSLLTRKTSALQYAIEECVRIKTAIVEQDEHEQNIRAWLNLGHTFAHAIESLTDYEWKHGEAVGVGLLLAAQLSEQQGLLSSEQAMKIQQLVKKAKLPTEAPAFPAATYWETFLRDKKAKDQSPHFILLKQIGAPIITHKITINEISHLLKK